MNEEKKRKNECEPFLRFNSFCSRDKIRFYQFTGDINTPSLLQAIETVFNKTWLGEKLPLEIISEAGLCEKHLNW